MFTVCSKCNLRLTVTATDLRAAQGYVRCGRCHNVFNALAALADEPGRPPESPPVTDTQSRLALKPTEPGPPEPEPEPDDVAPSEQPDTSLEFNPASTNINEVFIEATPGDRTGTFESIVLIGEAPAADPEPPAAVIASPASPLPAPAATLTPEPGPAPAPAPAPAPSPADNVVTVDVRALRNSLAEVDAVTPAASAALPAVAPPAAEPVAEVIATPVSESAVTATPASETADSAAAAAAQAPVEVAPPAAAPLAVAAEPPPADLDEAPFLDEAAADEIVSAMDVPAPLLIPQAPTPRMPRWAMPGVSVALALCLLVQLVHHYRSELADTTVLRGPLTALYQALGQPLDVRWDITSYEIRQLGATTDGAAAGDLVVRASISNRAPRDQPLPLLRVVMQDRFGNRVAARDLAPAEYLGRGAPQVSLMAPGQRVDVQVAFQDPGQSATGFEIDACMTSRDRSVTCANDPGAH